MPVTLLGFAFRAFSPRRSLHTLSDVVTFVTFAGGPVNPEFPRGPLERERRLQGFALREDSPPGGTG
jgi:hypothetical protein